MAFHDIVGNRAIHHILRRALERGRLPNSILFCGPQGVGKRRTARVLAQALNCLNMRDDACGECGPCRAIEIEGKKDKRGTFPDVLEYEIPKDKKDSRNKNEVAGDQTNAAEEPENKKDEKKKTVITIDQMRELRKLAFLKPMAGRRRVFIVTEADTMEDDAANALLKILEEPPLFTHIILLAENPALILPTIKSRCHTLTFLPISDEEIEKALLERDVPSDQARIRAIVCRGNIEKALETDWNDIESGRRDAWHLFSGLVNGTDPAALLRRYAYKREGGEKRAVVKAALADLLEMLSTFGRDAALLGEGGDTGLLINPDFETELRDAASRLGPGEALRFVRLVHGAAASNDKNGHFGALTTSLTAQWLRADEAQ